MAIASVASFMQQTLNNLSTNYGANVFDAAHQQIFENTNGTLTGNPSTGNAQRTHLPFRRSLFSIQRKTILSFGMSITPQNMHRNYSKCTSQPPHRWLYVQCALLKAILLGKNSM